jgi:hypothetical protein
MDEFLALVLHDIESSVEVSAIDDPVLIYKNVGGMKHPRPVGSRVDKRDGAGGTIAPTSTG